jgi:hypothetical protein
MGYNLPVAVSGQRGIQAALRHRWVRQGRERGVPSGGGGQERVPVTVGLDMPRQRVLSDVQGRVPGILILSYAYDTTTAATGSCCELRRARVCQVGPGERSCGAVKMHLTFATLCGRNSPIKMHSTLDATF